MNELKDFFGASVGAASALIGLLFVAITLAPEKVFGPSADSQKRGQAIGAFIALANVFFVSLAALIPDATALVVIVVALIAIYQIVRESITMARAFPELRGWHRFGLIALCIYALELALAVRLATKTGHPRGLVYTVLGLYGYALGTSWSLLGAHESKHK
jgi:hypothetical protein